MKTEDGEFVQRRCKIGNCVRIHGVVAAVPGGFGRFSSAPEDGRHHTADLAPPLGVRSAIHCAV